MACCGQNRATLANSDKAVTRPDARYVAQTTRRTIGAGPAATRIHYLRGGHVLVRGPRTGWQYEFSAASPVQAVDPRDAESLVGTGLFARTGQP